MTRFAAIFAASLLVAAPAVAGTYAAKPLNAPTAAKIIGKDISWACGTSGCFGATDSSRPLVICQDLAKRTGRLESFVVDGQPIAVADLDKCNTKASAPTALAHAN